MFLLLWWTENWCMQWEVRVCKQKTSLFFTCICYKIAPFILAPSHCKKKATSFQLAFFFCCFFYFFMFESHVLLFTAVSMCLLRGKHDLYKEHFSFFYSTHLWQGTISSLTNNFYHTAACFWWNLAWLLRFCTCRPLCKTVFTCISCILQPSTVQ